MHLLGSSSSDALSSEICLLFRFSGRLSSTEHPGKEKGQRKRERKGKGCEGEVNSWKVRRIISNLRSWSTRVMEYITGGILDKKEQISILGENQ